MSHLQVKNIPVDLHQQLRSLAKQRGRTVRDLVLEAVRRELAHELFVSRLRRRKPVNLGRPAAELLREVRAERGAGR
jgi:hypothetical protein